MNSWPRLQELSILGHYFVDIHLQWTAHFRALAGHLPRSLDVVRVLWDIPDYTLENTPLGTVVQYQHTIAAANRAAADCLIAYREQYGVPLHRWEYAVAPNASMPPIQKPSWARNPGSRIELCLEYKIVSYDVNIPPEDNPWKLSGYVVFSTILCNNLLNSILMLDNAWMTMQRQIPLTPHSGPTPL